MLQCSCLHDLVLVNELDDANQKLEQINKVQCHVKLRK